MFDRAFRSTARAKRIRNKVLALIEREALSTQEIGARIHLSARGAFSYIKTLREDKLVHIAGFDNSPKGSRRPLWKKGNLPDAQMMAKRLGKRHLKHAAHQADIFRFLMEKPRTAQQLGPLVGLCRDRMRRFIKELHGDGIYIADYLNRGHAYFPVYAVGAGPDVDRAEVVARQRKQRAAAAKNAAPWYAALHAPIPFQSGVPA